MNEGTPAELTVEEGKLESFLPLLGAEVTEEGKIRDVETGEIFESEAGEELTVDEIGYLGYSEDQRIIPVKRDFSDMVAHLSERDVSRSE